MTTRFDIGIQWQDDAWNHVISESVIRHTLSKILDFVTLPFFEISFVFANNSDIQKLNATYRKKNTPTNVLSFPGRTFKEGMLEDTFHHAGPLILGDIVMAVETVMMESTARNITPQHHTIHLIIHGFLHLIGYNHMEDHEAEKMESLETEILASLNIKNPYHPK